MVICILILNLINNNSGFGRLTFLAFRAPGLSISATVAATTPSTATTVCVPFAEENHGLFDALNHLILYSEKSQDGRDCL